MAKSAQSSMEGYAQTTLRVCGTCLLGLGFADSRVEKERERECERNLFDFGLSKLRTY